jgi:uncharacterized protein (TIGR02217 family)
MAVLNKVISPRITKETVFEVEHPSRIKIYSGDGSLEGQQFCDAIPRHRVNIGFGMRSVADFQELIDAFYVVMFTPYEGLLVKNWQDYRATLTNSSVLSLGGGNYQLQRKHTFGAINMLRNITKPSNEVALTVYNASNVALTPTIDYTTGIFTVSSGTPAKWTGEFFLPMTFSENKWTARLEVSIQNLWMSNDPVMMEEVPG